MEEIKLRIDWYTKTVLTVIALALCWFSVKPLFAAKEVSAYGERVDVNIAAIDGKSFGLSQVDNYVPALPVKGEVKASNNILSPVAVSVTNWPIR